MNFLKRLAARIFFQPKFVGQIAGFAAGAAAAFLCAELVPLVPDLVREMFLAAFELPPKTEISQPLVAALLTPAFTVLFNAIIAEALLKQSADVQNTLAGANLYTGLIDRWIGPDTKKSLTELVDRAASPDHTDL